METTIDKYMPVTIRIDESIHNSMKVLAKAKRVHVSALYEQAAETFLNLENAPKEVLKDVAQNANPRKY